MAGERVIGGRYAVGRKIAEGGMGSVFEGVHMLSKKTVALKLLAPNVGRDETTRQRFLREVAAPAQIGHDGIVEIYDAGFDPIEGILFVAMELLQGVTLRDRLLKGPPMQPNQVLDFFEQMLLPLAAAHRAGIVHRDLKPENVFLATKRDGTEVVKILDFGIARDLAGSDTVTQAGTAMGTPHYMSPEQAMSARDVSFSTDVWALGVMIYETLSGTPPFAGDTIATIVVEICTKPHRSLSEAMPTLPPAIAALVDRCLEKDAQKRPANAAEMLTALRQARGQTAPPVQTATREYAPTMMAHEAVTADQVRAHATGAVTAPLTPASSGPITVPAQGGFPATAAMQVTPPTLGGMASNASTPPTFAPRLTPPMGSSPSTPQFGAPPSYASAPGSAPPYASSPGYGAAPSIGTPGQMPTPSSHPGYAPAAPTPARRPAWLIPVIAVGSLGCFGVLGVVVLIFGLAVLGATVGGNAEVDGELAYGDPVVGRGAFGDAYDYTWSSGEHVVIALSSYDFDTVLIVRTPSGRELVDDDGGGGLNSRLDFVANEAGGYQVTATSYQSAATGRYHLSVRQP